MLRNNLKMAWRNLMRHKVFSLINISGLALGMTCSILILLWVKDELSFDRFHAQGEQLYRVMQIQHYPGADDLTTASHSGLLAEAMEQDLPEVEDAVRVTWGWQELFTHGDKAIKMSGRYADPTFFQMFSFPLLRGDAGQALQQPKSVVISDSVALKFFGTTLAVGKVFKVNNSESYRVTGVMESVPKNSSLQFDVVMPFDAYGNRPGSEWLKRWGNNGIQTYLLLKPETDIAAFNDKIKPYLKGKGEGANADMFVQAVNDMYLYGDFRQGKAGSGQIMYVRLFSMVAVFILIIACINFMNLATARSVKRAKEVGVRKAIGASKSALVWQFMVESILVAFLALFVSANLTGILLPHFNDLTGKAVTLDLSSPQLLVLLLGVALFTGVVSGSYPAFFLSSFNPVTVLKGTVRTGSGVAALRKGLVVFQFFLSALLIVSTLTVYLQMHYIRTKNIGLDRENVVYIPFEGELEIKYELVKRELLSIPGVTTVSAANQSPISISSNTGDVTWRGKEPGANILFDVMDVDYDFLETMGIKLREGRDFSREFGTDTAAYIINEEAARLMQMKEPVGQWLSVWKEGHIIGVVKDFHSNSMHVPVKPLVLQLRPWEASSVFVRIQPGRTPGALAAMEGILEKHSPAFPFDASWTMTSSACTEAKRSSAN